MHKIILKLQFDDNCAPSFYLGRCIVACVDHSKALRKKPQITKITNMQVVITTSCSAIYFMFVIEIDKHYI